MLKPTVASPILPTPVALALVILPSVTLPVDTVKLVPVMPAPVMEPVALTSPNVRKLPPCTLAVTAKLPKVPTEVMLFCAAVVNVPTMLVPDKLPPVMLPTALTVVAAVKLEVKFNADTTLLDKLNPAAFKLPPVTLPVTLTVVPV